MSQGIIQPSGRQFTPRAGTWLAEEIKTATSRVQFVNAEDDPTLIIGSIRLVGRKYQGRLYSKTVRTTTTAKSEPAGFSEYQYASISAATWDLRRRYKQGKETATQ